MALSDSKIVLTSAYDQNTQYTRFSLQNDFGQNNVEVAINTNKIDLDSTDTTTIFAAGLNLIATGSNNILINTSTGIVDVDGNLELKKKYNSKILGFELDKDRIPGIDILLKENQKHKIGKLEFEVIFVPGHTKGHIAFFFFKKKVVFTGDTLFSLGCGRVFEGTHEEMFNSLNKIKKLPPDTKIYCGHEYTKSNLNFCLKYDSKNTFLKEKEIEIQKKLRSNKPTIPTTLGQEIKTNIFFRCNWNFFE